VEHRGDRRHRFAGIWLLGKVALHVWVLLEGVGTVWYIQILDYGTTALEALGVALLWRKRSRDWFRRSGAVAGAV
jgi:hypothetical protein